MLGRVSRVLPGMQAAFIDVGLDRAAFLHVEDLIRPDDFEAYLSGGHRHEDGESFKGDGGRRFGQAKPKVEEEAVDEDEDEDEDDSDPSVVAASVEPLSRVDNPIPEREPADEDSDPGDDEDEDDEDEEDEEDDGEEPWQVAGVVRPPVVCAQAVTRRCSLGPGAT